MSPVKVTLTPSKEDEGEAEPKEEILTLETDEEEEEDGEKTEAERKVAQPQLWEKCLMMTEQPEEYDSQGWLGRPNEGDKWAKREAPKRQITQESSGDNDNDGRQTPPKQIRVHTGGTDSTDSRDQSSEAEHPKEDTKQ